MQDGTSHPTADALSRADLEGAALSGPERALLEYVRLLTEQPARSTDEDVDRLRRHGWTDEQIAEAVYVAALFAFFNRVADAFGLDDPHYRTMFAERSHPPGVEGSS